MKEDGRFLGKFGRYFRARSENVSALPEVVDTWPQGLPDEQILAEMKDTASMPLDPQTKFVAERLIMSGQGLEKGER